MDPRPIVDKNSGELPVTPNAAGAPFLGVTASPGAKSSDVRFPGEDGGKSLAEMAQRDLTATLQLLAERAQYITGATGAAIALRDQDEMVCRASAGSSAPEVGAQLQVNSGLSGESVRTQQTLRCDDAFTDARVNRESCEALGIRSVVVMPLIRGEEVIGVFELFSDKPHIFETRDLVALERMGTMVHTALEHSTAALGLPPMLGEVIQPARAPQASATLPAPPREQVKAPSVESAPPAAAMDGPSALAQGTSAARPGIVFHGKMSVPNGTPSAASSQSSPSPTVAPTLAEAALHTFEEDDVLEASPAAPLAASAASPGTTTSRRVTFESLLAQADPDPILSDVGVLPDVLQSAAYAPQRPTELPQAHTSNSTEVDEPPPAPLSLPRTAVSNLKKCQECGFPVSEGRTLCLDCEKKMKARDGSSTASASAPTAPRVAASAPVQDVAVPGEAPSFMAAGEEEASWLSTHKFMVIALVLAAIGVAVVVALR